MKLFFFLTLLLGLGIQALDSTAHSSTLECSDVLSLPKAQLALDIERIPYELQKPEDLVEVIRRVRRQSIPNKTYAWSHPDKGLVDVVKVGGLNHAYIAIFNHTTYMNLALGRITTYQTQKRVISDRNLVRKNSGVQNFGGHDIPAALIETFLKEVSRQAIDRTASPNDQVRLKIEEAFWDKVISPILKRDPEATFISAALDYRLGKTVSHEILHAYFYEKPELRRSIEKFWSEEVTDADKKAVLAVLDQEGYDTEDFAQVINEFYAYILEEGKAWVFPETLVSSYREKLTTYLEAAGIELPHFTKIDDL
jgi:hypothetical protein